MTIVGFDTSTAATSVCVLRGDGEAFEHIPPPSRLQQPPGHSKELLPLVRELMDRAGIGWGEVGAVAVGVGPGTFTGLRIGVATARALATAAAVPVHAVSSLTVLAQEIESQSGLPLIDAKRGEVFGALHHEGVPATDAFVTTPEGLEHAAGGPLAGVVAAGDGSIRFREYLEAAGVRVPPDGSELHVVRALHVCRLAREVPAQPPEAVLPTYIRDPDAKPSQ